MSVARPSARVPGGGSADVREIEDFDDPQSARALSVRTLLELVSALDRRVPQVQRAGEAAIASAAATLRAAALDRVKELDPEYGKPGGVSLRQDV